MEERAYNKINGKVINANDYRNDAKLHLKSGYANFRRNDGDGDDMDDLLQKYIEKVDRDQSDLKEDIRESERRNQKRSEDSERRLEDRMERLERLISGQSDKIDGLKEEVQKQLSEDKRYRHTNNIAIVLGVIATALTMVGIYYATVSMITDIIGVAVK